MPIYEYRCVDCGHELEAMQRISDPALTDCPACGQSSLAKLISAARFRLKGGGWYETDFKAGSKRNLHGDGPAESKAQAKGESQGPSGAQAKGEATSAGKSQTRPPNRNTAGAPANPG
jgi:putative FmdB family regulatory protein